jgi:hypothetical protein
MSRIPSEERTRFCSGNMLRNMLKIDDMKPHNEHPSTAYRMPPVPVTVKSNLGKTLLAFLLLALTCIPAAAGESSAFCFEEAGQTYGVPPGLLWAIAKVESGFDPEAVCYNDDGSYDYGVMQINSRWAASLGLNVWNKLDDPCTNVKVGARILADCLNRYGYTWEGIGCYNAVNLGKRAVYARKIIKVIDRMRKSSPRKSAR